MAPATAGAVLFEARHAAVSPRGATRKAGTFQLVLRLRFHGTAMSAADRRAPPAELTHRTRMIRALVAIATGRGSQSCGIPSAMAAESIRSSSKYQSVRDYRAAPVSNRFRGGRLLTRTD